MKPGNSVHPMANKRLNLVWLKIAERGVVQPVAKQIAASPEFSNPAVKCETLSSLVTTASRRMRDIIWGVPLAAGPGRLGDALPGDRQLDQHQRPRAARGIGGAEGAGLPSLADSVLVVLGEALLVGTVAGLASAGTYVRADQLRIGGIKFPVGFFASFYIPSLHSGGAPAVARAPPCWAASSRPGPPATSKWPKSSPRWRDGGGESNPFLALRSSALTIPFLLTCRPPGRCPAAAGQSAAGLQLPQPHRALEDYAHDGLGLYPGHRLADRHAGLRQRHVRG